MLSEAELDEIEKMVRAVDGKHPPDCFTFKAEPYLRLLAEVRRGRRVEAAGNLLRAAWHMLSHARENIAIGGTFTDATTYADAERIMRERAEHYDAACAEGADDGS